MPFTDLYTLFDLGPYTAYVLGIIIAWELIWKGFGMWKSARRGQPVWFIAILIFNTIGILPILYIFVFSKMRLETKKSKRKRR